jgi:hypothetical protein
MANRLRRTQREMTPDEELEHMIAQVDARIQEMDEEMDAQREPVLEEERRIYLERTVRELLNRGVSPPQIRRHIFPEPPVGRHAQIQHRMELGIVNELLRVHNEQRSRQALEPGRMQMGAESEQEKERRIYLERTVLDLLRQGYSYDQLAEIIWPTGLAKSSEIRIVNEIIRRRKSEMTPEQREAEKKTKEWMSKLTPAQLAQLARIDENGPATNKYLKYKNKYLQLKNKVFNL